MDVLQVWSGNNTLRGGAGDDNLIGGSGNDVLDGGPGNDRLWGTSGADLFVLSPGQDFIYDFALGQDRLVGSRGIFSETGNIFEVLLTHDKGSTVISFGRLQDFQHYNDLGLLWA
nr:hypothetical protein [Methylobacterium nodulans]